MPPRIALLALLSIALLTAGCIGAPNTGPSSSATPFPSGTTELPDGPKDRPERPATLNESSVRDYVHTYEYRFAYNSLWYSEHSDVNVECEVTDIAPRASGYVVDVRCYGYSNTADDAPGNETATELHADWGTQSVTYHVDGATTRRLDRDIGDTYTAAPDDS